MIEKTQILKTAISTFTSRGLKRVSIDDICFNLSIPKKDFYEHYEEKGVLIDDFLQAEFGGIFAMYEKMKKAFPSPLELMVRYNQYLIHNLILRNGIVLRDLKEFYPENYETYMHLRSKVAGTIEELLRTGVEQKFFRKDIVPAHMAELRVTQLESILLPPIDRPKPSREYHEQVFEHYIYGIAGYLGMGGFPQTSLN